MLTGITAKRSEFISGDSSLCPTPDMCHKFCFHQALHAIHSAPSWYVILGLYHFLPRKSTFNSLTNLEFLHCSNPFSTPQTQVSFLILQFYHVNFSTGNQAEAPNAIRITSKPRHVAVKAAHMWIFIFSPAHSYYYNPGCSDQHFSKAPAVAQQQVLTIRCFHWP